MKRETGRLACRGGPVNAAADDEDVEGPARQAFEVALHGAARLPSAVVWSSE